LVTLKFSKEILRDLAVFDGGFIEGQDLFSFSLESSAKLSGLQDTLPEGELVLEGQDGVSGVDNKLGESFLLEIRNFRPEVPRYL
jgi:hypothetical protein